MRKTGKWKEILAIIMAFAMLAVYVPMTAEAAEEPAVLDAIEVSLEVKAVVGEAPAISGTCLTEGAELEYAYIQSVLFDLDNDVQYAFYSDEEMNRKEKHPLKEIKADTKYEIGVSLVVSDLSKYLVPKTVTIVCNDEEYEAGKFDISREEGTVTVSMSLYEIDTTAVLNGWIEEDGTTVYYKDGKKVTGFQTIDGKKYYFDRFGARQIGWTEIDGKWYYMKEKGGFETGLTTIGKKTYYFDKKGVMQTGTMTIGDYIYTFDKETGAMTSKKPKEEPKLNGWKQEKNKWYYYKDGVKLTGWQQLAGKWYYLGSDGAMVDGWQQIDNKWYFFKDGVMQNGWQQIGNSWYFFRGGAMVKGWQKIGKDWYFFSTASKTMGVMKTGWVKSGGKWYYMDKASGAMLYNTTKKIDGKVYNFNKDGICTNP